MNKDPLDDVAGGGVVLAHEAHGGPAVSSTRSPNVLPPTAWASDPVSCSFDVLLVAASRLQESMERAAVATTLPADVDYGCVDALLAAVLELP